MNNSTKYKVQSTKIRKGFTLIELLVVISIIGLLSGLVISNVAGVRERARDVQRKSDLDQIKKALRMYYNDHNAYPTTAIFTGTGEFKDPDGPMVYMKVVPTDPSTSTPYTYSVGTCIDDFRVVAVLENKSDDGITKSQSRCAANTCGAPATYTAGTYVVCAD